MKFLENYQLITLEDGKEYVVIDSVIYEGKNVAFLISKDNIKEQVFVVASKENDELSVDIIDENNETNKVLIENLSKIFVEDVINNMSGGMLDGE